MAFPIEENEVLAGAASNVRTRPTKFRQNCNKAVAESADYSCCGCRDAFASSSL